jgi:DNA-directed RNA polymerase subunit N (RpoN/RPB10)
MVCDQWRAYEAEVANSGMPKTYFTDGSEPPPKTAEFIALQKLGVTRYCCRRMFLTNCDIMSSGAAAKKHG